mgnify:CR=1 FL=1
MGLLKVFGEPFRQLLLIVASEECFSEFPDEQKLQRPSQVEFLPLDEEVFDGLQTNWLCVSLSFRISVFIVEFRQV